MSESWQAEDQLGVRVLIKTVHQPCLDLADLVVEGGDDRDQCCGGGRKRINDQVGRGQLVGEQRGLDLVGAPVEFELPTATAQCSPDLADRQAPSHVGRGSLGQHCQRVVMGQIGPKRNQRGREELSQGGAQLVDLTLPGPDQVLVGPGQHG